MLTLQLSVLQVFIFHNVCTLILVHINKIQGSCVTPTLKVLVATMIKIDAQWEGMGDVGLAKVGASNTSSMLDHNCFKLQ